MSERILRTLILVAAGLTLFLAALYLFRLPQEDEALLILQSWLIAQGKIPYRDFFEFILPGSLYLGAAVTSVTGLSVLTLRLLSLLAQLSSLWAISRLARPYLGRWGIPLLIFFGSYFLLDVLLFTHHVFSAALAVWAVYCLTGWSRTGNSCQLSVGFLCIGLAFVVTQSTGMLLVALLAPAVVFLMIRRQSLSLRTVGMHMLLPFVLPLIILLGFLANQGAAGDFFHDTVGWLSQGNYSKTSAHWYFATGFKDLLNLVISVQADKRFIIWRGIPAAILLMILAWLPVFGCLWSLEILVRRRGIVDQQPFTGLLILTLGALALTLSTLSFSTAFHIAMTCLPGLLLGFIAMKSLLRPRPLFSRILVSVFSVLLCLGLGFKLWKISTTFFDKNSWVASHGTVDKAFFTMAGPDEALTYSVAVEFIRAFSRPGDPVFIYNSSPEFYLLADRKPLGRFQWIYPVYTTPAQMDEILQTLNRTKPKVIVYDMKLSGISRDIRFKQYPAAQLALPELDRFLVENGYRVSSFNSVSVYHRP